MLRAGWNFGDAGTPPPRFVTADMQASVNAPAVLFWAVIRIILGIAQMAGAIVLAVCLCRYGAGRETIIALFVTMDVTVLSIVLFRLLKVQGEDRP